MAFDVNNTYEYLLAVQQITPPTSFLRDRYFPSTDADIFASEKVLAEYRDGSKKLAPVIAPRVGGVTVLRQGSELNEYAPPTIAPKRTTTIDDLTRRGFGEAILPTLTPEERESQLALRDAAELDDLITRREEQIASELLQNNGYVLKQVADNLDVYDEYEIMFYDGGSNPAAYTVSTAWNQSGADILGDLKLMIQQLTSRGLPATDLIVGDGVAEVITSDPDIYAKLLIPDGKYNLGRIDPKTLPNGAAFIASLNVYGRNIDILSYTETYTNDAGVDTPYIAPGKAILTAPAAGKALYGAVTQIEQSDSEFHTYAARRVPKVYVDADKNVKEVTLTSRPLLVPVNKAPFVIADVL
jgi:hypothetical protein